jgi:DNA-binding NtrC family response regulator
MEADDFVAPAHALDEGPGAVDPPQSLPFREARDRLVAEFTVQYVRRALEISRGNISAAARASGLERQHFQQLMKKHAVDAGEFRKGCK